MRCLRHKPWGARTIDRSTTIGACSPDSFLQDVTVVEGGIHKRSATGSLLALRHVIDYDANTRRGLRSPTIWNTKVEGEFRQPLLLGAGVEYNRIAGPTGVPGVANGVLVARVNTRHFAGGF